MDTLLRRRELMAIDTAPSPIFHTWLVFDGTAYIDTDILIPENGSVRVILGYETTQGLQALFNAGGRVYALLNNSTDTTRRYFTVSYDSGSSLISGTTFDLLWTFNTYSFFLTPNLAGIGDVTYPFTKGSSRPESGLVIGQNYNHTSTAFTGRCAMYRIYGSDAQNATTYSDLGNYTPVYRLRPCTYLGEAGLWCVETSTFYGNSNSSGTLSVAD